MPRMPDAVYFAQRAEEEHAAKVAAADEGARLAHRQLERAYEALAASAQRDRPAPFRRPGHAPRHDPAPQSTAPAAELWVGWEYGTRDEEGSATR